MSEAEQPLPPLRRDLDIVPYAQEGKPMYVLADNEAEGDRALALSPGGMAVASLFDGRRTAADVAAEFSRQTGAELRADDVLGVARQLETAGLLESGAAAERRRARARAFRDNPSRPAQFAGKGGYPAQPLELASFVGKFFQDPKGPGRPLPAAPTKAPAVGLFSPHIDLHRGGPAYAWSYAALADSPPPDVVVALGVAHASPPSPWVFTRKEYQTPYGAMKVDGALYSAMRKELWYDPLDDEMVHRREHSLEFQALWLRYLWREKTPPWVPILCSSFERWAEDRSPSSVATVEGALSAIGERLAAEGKKRRVLVLCGIDLAHVGPRFGDDLELTAELEKKIEAEDRVSLQAALSLDAEAFYASVVKDGHWRKVCGLSAAYTGLRWLKAMTGGRAKGELLTYGQAPDPMGGVVSFAGAIYRPEA